MKDEILTTATTILKESGIKRLTQPEICKQLNIRQSQLTYYFPKRSDIVAALVERFNEQAKTLLQEAQKSKTPDRMVLPIYEHISKRQNFRVFLGLLVESDSDTVLKDLIRDHIWKFGEVFVQYTDGFLSRSQSLRLLDFMRGLAIREFSELISEKEARSLLRKELRILLSNTKQEVAR